MAAEPARLPRGHHRLLRRLERLSLSILPIYAVALDLAAGYFTPAFQEPQYQLRMSHYPHTPELQHNDYGLAPNSQLPPRP